MSILNIIGTVAAIWFAASVVVAIGWSLAFRKWGTPTPETPIVKARS